jgi:restriction endonuclease S subunit
MKKGWAIKTLGEIGKVSMCKRILKKQTSPSGDIPFYKIGTFGKTPNAFIDREIYLEYQKKYSFPKKGDILISASGTIGRRVVYDGEPGYFQDSNIVWIDNNERLVSNEYLHQFYGACDWNPSKGATISRLYNDDLRRIPIPPLSEQEEIVEVLDKAFAAIDQAKANIEQNIANAKELFQSKLNQIFSQKGEGWVSGTINDLVKNGVLSKPSDGNHGEIHPKKADFVEKGIPFVMASDLQNGEVNQTDCNFITKIQADKLRKGFAEDGDVLLSHKGTIGRVAKLQTELDYIMLTPQVTYYRITDDEILTGDYLYFYLRSPLFQKPLQHIAGAGSTRAYIGITKQRELEIAYPTCIKEQSDIAHSLRELERKTDAANQLYVPKLASLDELKKSILQKAFAGELT